MKFHTSQFNSMRYKLCVVGYDRSLTKGTLLEEESTFTAYLGFHWRDFNEISYLAI
jgi:hypothetical protein